MSAANERAATPDDLTRLFVERANARDAEGLAELYEPEAVLAYPPSRLTEGRDAIRAVYERMVTLGLRFEPEVPLPTLQVGDVALTSTHRRDGSGVRVQVARRQADGSWLRIIDRPEAPEQEQPAG